MKIIALFCFASFFSVLSVSGQTHSGRAPAIEPVKQINLPQQTKGNAKNAGYSFSTPNTVPTKLKDLGPLGPLTQYWPLILLGLGLPAAIFFMFKTGLQAIDLEYKDSTDVPAQWKSEGEVIPLMTERSDSLDDEDDEGPFSKAG